MIAIRQPGNRPNPGTATSITLDSDATSGDFQSIIIGNSGATNVTLDPDSDRPISQLVLETYGIPFVQPVLGGSLPGYDIRNQDATNMLRLSLISELTDGAPPGSNRSGVGGLAEVELDGEGIGRFYIVGRELATNLDVRYCVPTGQIVNAAELVIVRGYDPPIARELRQPFDGMKNPDFMGYDDCAAQTCEEEQNSKFATISYDDPALDQAYNDDIVNSYEIGAFESLLGYVVDFDVLGGQPTPEGVRISFGESTKEYIRFDASIYKSSMVDGTIPLEDFVGFEGGKVIGAGRARGAAVGGPPSSSVPATVTTVNQDNGVCTTSTASVVGGLIRLSKTHFERLNKYGELESDLIGIQDIVFSGQKVFQIQEFAGAPGFGATGFAKTIIDPKKELISLQHGRNWTWTTDGDGGIEINLFSIIDSTYTSVICRFYDNNPAASPGVFEYRESTKDDPNTFVVLSEQYRDYICAVGDSLGYKVVSGEMCIIVERRRPSIDIFDPGNNAMSIAGSISITYTPIVLVDIPPPIAFASLAILNSIDEDNGGPTASIGPTGIIDQTDGIIDAQPATVQNLGASELSILQDNTTGSTIDMTLPFLDEDECLEVAENYLAEQNEVVTTTSIVLGPDSTPRLGDIFTDDNGNTSVINEINYSYSDASQYLITVTTGPKYLTSGSFNNSQYQLQTEDVTKEATIVQDRGDGATYVVRLRGGDEIVALSFILEDIGVGDKCQVKIFNNPVETI
ncbi:hypothetical protein LCGC14_1030160 [marine sediment metagenome]|uniref:Uncharacterized protein n=1 Tax=marine sediment metagenome TaxID=412755 RepID=A0A0F9QCW1_9ZZZZ